MSFVRLICGGIIIKCFTTEPISHLTQYNLRENTNFNVPKFDGNIQSDLSRIVAQASIE